MTNLKDTAQFAKRQALIKRKSIVCKIDKKRRDEEKQLIHLAEWENK